MKDIIRCVASALGLLAVLALALRVVVWLLRPFVK